MKSLAEEIEDLQVAVANLKQAILKALRIRP